MSLPSTAYFTTSYGKILGYGFVNCGWFDTPSAILYSIDEAYEGAKRNAEIKHIKREDFSDERLYDHVIGEIENLEARHDIELFPENWENKWFKVQLYGVEVFRSDLIKLGKKEIEPKEVEDSIAFQQAHLKEKMRQKGTL